MSNKFGQLVIGPPGSGKSTYCSEMATFLRSLGRKVAIVNIDPANDTPLYDAFINISSLITVDEVMNLKKLGPNGALLYAMEYLDENISWLINKLESTKKGTYFIFDCPGQIELYTHHESVKNVIEKLVAIHYNLCAIYLVDSHYCNDPGKFVSALMLTLNTMLHIHLPHVNVLSKVDLMSKFADKLPFGLEFYTDVMDLKYILNYLQEDKATAKFKKFNSALVGIIEGYGLVSFMPLNIKDKRMMVNIKRCFDKANGYIYNAGEEKSVQSLLACAVGAQTESDRIGIDRDLYSTSNDSSTNESK